MPGKPFTFICGDDDFLVSERGKAWFEERTAGLADDLSKEVIDGRAGNVAEVGEAIRRFTGAVRTLSLFGERKVVWLKDVGFLANSQTGNAQGTLDLLEDLKAVLGEVDPAQVDVLITAHPVYKVRAFYKWVRSHGDFSLLDGGKDGAASLVRMVRGECERAGARIDSEAAETLVAKLNGNTRLAVEEIRKLATFAGEGGVVDERLVVDLVPNFGDADFFEAADAFFSLDLAWTLEALKRHFFNNSESRPLLGSLQSRNRLLIQLRVLIDAKAIRAGGRGGLAKADLDAAGRAYAHHFGEATEKSNLNVFTQHPYYLGRLAQDAGKIPLKRLVDFQIAFAEAFEGILERPNDQESVIREMALRCLA